MKLRAVPVEVVLQQGRPVAIRTDGRQAAVERVVDTWVVQGRWWAREERRTYFRLETTQGVVDVYLRGNQWYLARVLD